MSDTSSDDDGGDSDSASSSSSSGSSKASGGVPGSKTKSAGKKLGYDGDDPNYDPDSRLTDQPDEFSLDKPDPVLNNALEGTNMKCLKGTEDGCL